MQKQAYEEWHRQHTQIPVVKSKRSVKTVFHNCVFVQKETAAIAAVKSALSILEQHLLENTYLVTDYITLADIICWANLIMPYKQV